MKKGISDVTPFLISNAFSDPPLPPTQILHVQTSPSLKYGEFCETKFAKTHAEIFIIFYSLIWRND